MRSFHASLLTLVLASPLVSLANHAAGAADGPLDDSTKNKPSIQWKKADDEITGKFNKVELAKLKTTTEALHALLQDSILCATGLESVWHAQYSADRSGNLINYGIDCEFASTADGTATSSPADLTVTINDFSSLAGHITIDNKDYMTLPAAGAVRNQCPYFEFQGGTTPENAHTPNRNIWVVTARPDVLPYTPITRKEYLDISIGWLGDTKAQIIADVEQRTPVRSREQQEAAKKRELDELSSRYSGAELQMRTQMYMDNYKSDEDYLKEHIDQATADVDSTISFIKGMLNRLSAATLSAPAIISPNTREFEGFRDGEPGMVMLIRNNPNFSQPGAAPEKPQFFLITWNSEPGDDAAQSIGAQIAKSLDTRYFKTMLPK
ncbi:MAG TPA: hypothetical protein VGS79_08070 [Puia sp.]|nr:hypothetical protein [Puia sp.]